MSTGNETDERDPYAPPPEGSPDRPPAAPWNVRPGNNGRPSPEQRPRPPREPREPREPRDAGDPDQRPPRDPRVTNARVAVVCGTLGLLASLFLMSDLGRALGTVLGVSAVLVGAWVIRKSPAPAAGPRIENGPGGTAHHPGHASRPVGMGPAGTLAARRPGRPAGALAGVVSGTLALAVSLSVWGFQLANRDYYDCMDKALTKTAQDACLQKLPDVFHQLVKNT